MSEDTALSIESILAAKDVRYQTVPVPEWGGSVRIGSLSAGDMIEWLDINREVDGRGRSAGLHLLIKALVDDTGKRIGKPEHVDAFKMKDTQVCGRIVNVVMEMNGLGGRRVADVLFPELVACLTALHDAAVAKTPVDLSYLTRTETVLGRAKGGVESSKNVSSEAVIAASHLN